MCSRLLGRQKPLAQVHATFPNPIWANAETILNPKGSRFRFLDNFWPMNCEMNCENELILFYRWLIHKSKNSHSRFLLLRHRLSTNLNHKVQSWITMIGCVIPRPGPPRSLWQWDPGRVQVQPPFIYLVGHCITQRKAAWVIIDILCLIGKD